MLSFVPKRRLLSSKPVFKMQQRNYRDAVTALNSLQTNSSILEQLRKSGGRMNATSIPEMREWLRRINYTPEDLNSLNMIHITGTKGKGSTCAFVSSILQQLYPQWRIGLFTSPHLKAVNERIQVNSVPISEDDFARYFWEVWDRLEAFEPMEGSEIQFDKGRKPVYFRFLTLMAWHAFMDMKVDTAIMEVGVGGEYDSTNLVTRPTATGVTSLGIDHVTVLGNTVESIAWHKGGIYKKGVAAFSVEQPEGALEVLQQRAAEKETTFTVVPVHPVVKEVKLGIAGTVQQSNASLAIALVQEHLKRLGLPAPAITPTTLPPEIITALENARWPGRCETRVETDVTWYCDGAHTAESIAAASQWYSSIPRINSKVKVLLFNQQTRNATALLRTLVDTSKVKFDKAIFCTNITFKQHGYKDDLMSMNTSAEDVTSLKVQHELQQAWQELSPNSETFALPTIEEAVDLIRSWEGEKEVFVTGSLHLIGGLFVVLDERKVTV